MSRLPSPHAPRFFPTGLLRNDRGAHGGRDPIFAFLGRGYRAGGAAHAAGSCLRLSETENPSPSQIIRDSAARKASCCGQDRVRKALATTAVFRCAPGSLSKPTLGASGRCLRTRQFVPDGMPSPCNSHCDKLLQLTQSFNSAIGDCPLFPAPRLSPGSACSDRARAS